MHLTISIIPWSIFLLLPLAMIIDNQTVYPHVVAKGLYLRTIIPFLLSFALFGIASKLKIIKEKKLFFVSGVLFLGICFIASYLGQNFHTSFWSTLERMQGLLTYSLMFSFFIVITLYFENKHWFYWFFGHIVIGIILCLIELSPILLNPHELISNQLSFITTSGNKAYFASFITSCLLCSIILMESFTLKRKPFVFLIGSACLFIISIFLTFNRTSLVATSVGIVVWTFLSSKNKLTVLSNKKKMLFIITGFILLIGILIFFTRQYSISMLSDTTTLGTRIEMWKIALKGLNENPLWGSGVGHYNYYFDKHYPPLYPKSEDWVDNAHSLLFEVISTTGILGFILFLTMTFQYIKGIANKSTMAISIVTILLVKQLFLIESNESLIITLSILAYFFQSNTISSKTVIGKSQKILLPISLILSILFSINNFSEYQTSRTFIQNNLTERISQNRDDYLALKAKNLLLAVRTKRISLPESHLQFESMRPHIEETLTRKKNSIMYKNLFAELYFQFGNPARALEILNESIQLSPQRAKTYLIKARIFNSLGYSDLNRQEIKKAAELDPIYKKFLRH